MALSGRWTICTILCIVLFKRLTEVWKIYEPIFSDPVWYIHHLLVRGIQSESLHGFVKILRVYRSSPQACLQRSEHCCHVLKLLVCQHVWVVGDVVGHLHLGCRDHVLQKQSLILLLENEFTDFRSFRKYLMYCTSNVM